jgi:hypothetical protein
MRCPTALTSIFVAVLALAACSKGGDKAAQAGAAPASAPSGGGAAIQAADLPRPAPGLWKMTVNVMGHDQVMQICMDEAYVAKTKAWGQDVNASKCSRQDFQKGLDGSITFSSECEIGNGGHVSTKGKVTGDLTRHYKITMDATSTGAGPANGSHTMTTESERVGDCPAGMKGGDMVLPGGMKMSADRMAKYQKQAEQLKGISGQVKVGP